MTLLAQYYLKIDPAKYPEILGVLKNLEFEIKNAEDVTKTAITNNPNGIVCFKNFPDDQIYRSIDTNNFLHTIDGVTTVLFMPTQKKSKTHLIPISLSTAVTFLLIIGAIYKIKSEPSIEDILLIAGIPTAVTFLSQILFRYFKGS